MANDPKFGHVRGNATSYSQDLAHRMLGAGFGHPEGPDKNSWEAHVGPNLGARGISGNGGYVGTALPIGTSFGAPPYGS